MPSLPRTLSAFLLVVFLLQACKENKAKQVNRAVYYWKNIAGFNQDEKDFLKKNRIQKVYAKVLDVDWDEVRGPIPLSINNIEHFYRDIYPSDSLSLEIVPVIFITNKTFAKIDSSAIPQMALHIVRKCFTQFDSIDAKAEDEHIYYHGADLNVQPREIQFDCDWTVSTAKKYFFFLETVKKMLAHKETKLSATIRLHQYKYPGKTGVPPVAKGALMVYNVSDLTQYGDRNSIFDEKKVKEYIKEGSSYPLPLDMALPAFAWGISYSNKKFVRIENGVMASDLQDKEYFHEHAPNYFAVKKDTVMNNWLMRPGDEIKIEAIDEKKLMQAARLAKRALNTDEVTITLFDLSARPIKQYSHETIDEVYNSFK